MTVAPGWLGGVIALVLGRKPDTALVRELARVLETREEVLPWLMLRQGAFADDPEIVRHLKALAAHSNRASHHRPPGPAVPPERLAMDRATEKALHDLIAQNVAQADLANDLGATLHRHNHTLPGRPDYDFRRRIVEHGPEPKGTPETGDSQA
jgi:hypothetical protein